MRRVLVTGGNGQLARELVHRAPAVEVFAPDRATLDITDAGAVSACVAEFSPEVVINAAAYTAVDRAESDAARAHRVNAGGAAHLAAACAISGARLLHVSTDFVFDGASSLPYLPDAPTAPLGVYGESKLAGEQRVRETLPGACILRTGWVYSCFGSNFVATMLRLMAERETLAVVDNQVGTPTWTGSLADVLWAFAGDEGAAGVYHWSDAGVCSWYDFAVAIAEEGLAMGLLPRAVRVQPIPASEYPTPAQRPAYSVLDKRATLERLGAEAVHWRVQLRRMLQQWKDQTEAATA